MWHAEEKYRALSHRPWCKIHWLCDMQSSTATPLHPVSSPRQLEFLAIRGGSTNMTLELAKVHPGSRIGLVIAGNSGRPGGACGHMDKFNRPYVDSLHHHSTQEEDVVSNWLLTHQKAEGTDPNKLFANTIGGEGQRTTEGTLHGGGRGATHSGRAPPWRGQGGNAQPK